MIKIEAYHCDFCKKYSKSKSVIAQHEKSCFYNKKTKSCATCEHYAQKNHKYPKLIEGGSFIDVNQPYPICTKGILFFESIPKDEVPLMERAKLVTSCDKWQQKIDNGDEDQ